MKVLEGPGGGGRGVVEVEVEEVAASVLRRGC